MGGSIPVNPKILHWARITANLSVEDVVRKIKRKLVNAETIEAWEKGEESPTYAQLERLAYKIYKRPLALFFFPEPPDEETPEQSFRTLPDIEITRLSTRIRLLIRKARVLQINLSELNDSINPASRPILGELSFNPGVAVGKMAETVRSYLDVDLSTQGSWKDTENAFKAWRNILEEYGVFVFKDAFRDDSVSGFCLYDEKFPIIYVNNSMPHSRQVFTLFHELAHLFFRTGGIDARSKDYVNLLKGDKKKIETLCNQFAGEFLVPSNDFNLRIVGIKVNDISIEKLAKRYHVSREVILRKLLDKNIVSAGFYRKRVEDWAKAAYKKTVKGGNPYLTKGVYLGYRYLEMAFRRYYQKRISIDQLANYLGTKVRYISGMESLFHKHGLTK